MSENTENNGESTEREQARQRQLANLRPFQPGQSGNPGGRPKKKPITDLYAEILDDPEALNDLRVFIRKTFKKGNMAAVLQLREMTERIEGKVVTPIEADVNVTATLSDRMAKARERAGSR